MRTRRLTARRGDRGAVLVIVAVFAIVAVLMLAAVVDLGGLREEKKEVTLSTDAAALAGVSLANMADPDLTTIHSLVPCVNVGVDPVLSAAGKNPQNFGTVQQVVNDYLSRNGSSNPVDCRVARSGINQGYVVVSADEVVPYKFATAVGQQSGRVGGMSVAARATGLGGGLRPVGICAVERSLNEKSPGTNYAIETDILSQGTLDARGVKVLGTPITVVMEKEHLKKDVDACNTGDASGQRGQVNFDGKNGNGGQKCDDPAQPPDSDQSYVESFRDGYHGQINSYVEQDSGNDFNSSQDCLDTLIASNQRVWLPVYDSYDRSRQSFQIVGFVEVEFEGYCLQNGSSENDPGNTTPCKYTELDAEWFRVKVYGSFTPKSFPATPPLTSDAQASQSFICAYESGSALLQSQCTAAVGAVSGPPPAPQPTPSCQVSSLKIRRFADPASSAGSSLAVPWANGNDLSVKVALDFTVATFGDCAGLKLRLGSNDLGLVTPTSNSFIVALEAGEKNYQKSSSHAVSATDAAGTVTLPETTLTVGA